MPVDTSPEAVERVAAKLTERTLIAHGGPEGIRHGWNLTPADSELHAEAAALLRALSRERGWIATSERLPERNQEVLFYKDCELVQGYYSHNGQQWYCWHRYDDSGEVGCAQPVAWQPLPPPPATLLPHPRSPAQW